MNWTSESMSEAHFPISKIEYSWLHVISENHVENAFMRWRNWTKSLILTLLGKDLVSLVSDKDGAKEGYK